MGLTQLTTSPAVSLAEAKAHLRVVGTQDDAAITGYALAATQFIEGETRTTLAGADFVLTLPAFPAGREIPIPRPPLRAVTAVKYTDAAGTLQTLAPSSYVVDADAKPGRVVLAAGASWPATAERPNAVRIEFAAGYASADAIPQLLKQAVLLMLGHYYENREAAIDRRVDTVPLAVQSIVNLTAYPEVV